jgi:hypothetical protein
MPQVTGQVSSYENTAGQPRSLVEIITNIAPADTPAYSRFGDTKAIQTMHEWTKDTLQDPEVNARIEGAETVNFAGSQVTGASNRTQILQKAVQVSGTSQAVKQVGLSNQYNYQLALRMKEVKKDAEFAILSNQVESSVDKATARRMRGLAAWIMTNFFGGAGGAAATPGVGGSAAVAGTARALTHDMIADAIQAAYEQGGNPTLLMAAPSVRRRVTNVLKTVNIQNEDVTDKRSTDTIRVYESDFGTLTIVANRVQAKVPYAMSALFLLDTQYWKKAFLRGFFEQPLALTGDSKKGHIIGEFTLEARAEESSAMIADIDPTLS